MPRKQSLPEWISAHAALKMLYPHHGGYYITKLMLAELLKDGELDARVGESWDSKRSTLTTAWGKQDRLNLHTDLDLTHKDWGVSRFWSDDLDNWRWKDNRFVLTQSKSPALRTFLVDVTFRASQISALIPSNRKGIGGRKIDAAAWGKIGVALIKVAQEGYFRAHDSSDPCPPPRFSNPTEFIARVLHDSDDAYDSGYAHQLLAPVYYHFFPQTQRLSSRNDDPDTY